MQFQVRGNCRRHELTAPGKADAELLCSVPEEVLLGTALLLGERKTRNETKEELALSDRSRPPLFVLGNDSTSTPSQEPDGRARHISSSNMTEEGSERVCHFTGVAEPRAQNLAVRPRKPTGRGPVGPKK